jgi:hypothetical protein
MAAVLKTVVPKGTRGSNPLASAIMPNLLGYSPPQEGAIMDEPPVQMKSAGFSAGRNKG